MPDEKPMSSAEQKALHAEMRADEHAARAPNYGEADAATYEQRVRDGAATVRQLEPEPVPVSPADLERVVSGIEQSWSEPTDKFKAIMQGSVDPPAADQTFVEQEKGRGR